MCTCRRRREKEQGEGSGENGSLRLSVLKIRTATINMSGVEKTSMTPELLNVVNPVRSVARFPCHPCPYNRIFGPATPARGLVSRRLQIETLDGSENITALNLPNEEYSYPAVQRVRLCHDVKSKCFWS